MGVSTHDLQRYCIIHCKLNLLAQGGSIIWSDLGGVMMLYINPIFVSVYLFVCAFACLFGSLFAVFLCCHFEYFCVSHLFHVRITARLSSILQRGIPLEFNDFLSRFSYWLFTTMFLLSFSNKNNFIKTVRLIL